MKSKPEQVRLKHSACNVLDYFHRAKRPMQEFIWTENERAPGSPCWCLYIFILRGKWGRDGAKVEYISQCDMFQVR